jgi:hypothetical protein
LRWITKNRCAPDARHRSERERAAAVGERRLRRLRTGQLYSAGRDSPGMESPIRRSLGPPSSRISKDGSYGPKPPAPGWASPSPRRSASDPYGSPEFGSSSASRCDKRTAGKRPGRRSPATGALGAVRRPPVGVECSLLTALFRSRSPANPTNYMRAEEMPSHTFRTPHQTYIEALGSFEGTTLSRGQK